MIRYLILFISIIFSTALNAECNFKSADYLSELNDPNSIKEIKIEVSKSGNFYENALRILTSGTKDIPPKLRKRYKANITIRYDFGNCFYKGNVRQHGDHRDHIVFKNGEIHRSLQVKLKNGNIINSVRFKLFLPETRGNLNEILATTIFRELGFIAPETFQVKTDVNGLKGVMIFQESIRKEMLERNSRTEGPLFEGDETLLFVDGKRIHVDDISLSRQLNRKWFLKGKQSALISLKAFNKLQAAYLTRADNINLFDKFIQPNSSLPEIFQHFHFVSLALNAGHGLIPHNRVFYYNIFLDDFEPVYYDGDVKFKKFNNLSFFKEDIFKLSFNKDYIFPYLKTIDSEKFEKQIYSKFRNRTILNNAEDDKFVKESLKILKTNILTLQNTVRIYSNYIDYRKYSSKTINHYIDRIIKHNIDQQHIIETYLHENSVEFKYLNGTKKNMTYENLSNLISEMKLFNGRSILIKNNVLPNEIYNLKNEKILDGYFVGSSSISVIIDSQKKRLEIYQETPNDWILFKNVKLKNWNINFNGKKKTIEEPNQDQRFNEFGMTGCLSFYNSNFDTTTIYSKDASCEDSINIVSSRGHINKIIIEDSYQDALDLDFSNIKIDFAQISNAGNDCIDVSAGNYFFGNVKLYGCGDKGISVGEKSKFESLDIFIKNSKLAVSSKDLSTTTVKKAEFINVKECYQAIQKKQEFGGAIIKFKDSSCFGKNIIDSNSSLKSFSNEL